MRISLADMLWTVGLLALASLGVGVTVRDNPDPLPGFSRLLHDWRLLAGAAMLWQAPVSLCAGLAAPFRRKTFGAILGISFWAVVLIVGPFPPVRATPAPKIPNFFHPLGVPGLRSDVWF